MKKTIIVLSFLLFMVQMVSAQMGIVEGKVIEVETAYEVIGASIIIEELNRVVTTDLEGKYRIEDIAEGEYTLLCSYLGFDDQKSIIKIEKGQLLTFNIQIKETAITTQTAIVTASKINNTESAVLSLKKQSTTILDGISASEISNTGDGTAAAAIKRITGVTVEGGKYVYVRGLGDRYGKMTLNGADIPGLDPNRNAVQMDLFPSNLIANVLVYKTFMPNLPGDFTGGYIDITTKDFPSQFNVNIGASIGYDTRTTFNSNFITHNKGKLDWLGFDDGTRALPSTVANADNIPNWQSNSSNQFDPIAAQKLVDMTRSFSNNWEQKEQAVPFNHSLSLSIGNQFKVFKKPLGIIGALSYKRDYSFYEGGNYGIYQLAGMYDQVNALTSSLSLKDKQAKENVLWGAMLGLSYKLLPTHKITLLVMHNQSSNSITRYLEGTKDDDIDEVFQTRSSQFLQRGLTTVQLGGKHVFTTLNSFTIDWKSSYAKSTQTNPDLRYFTNRYDPYFDAYSIKISSDRAPSRFYRDMQQINWSNKLNIALPFKQWNQLSSKLKAGFAHTSKDRVFDEKRYTFDSRGIAYQGNINDYFAQNLIATNTENSYFANNGNGIYIANGLDSANVYSANQMVLAGYLMVELPLFDKLSLITGARLEYTNIKLATISSKVLEIYPMLDGKANLLDNLDILPSVILNYEPIKNLKIKAAYARTLARPSFRELAPFNSFDVEGGYVLVGNPNVKRTLIDNVDLRFEYYLSSKELISVGAFYKNFTNPIERTFNIQAFNPEITFRNVDRAFLAGVEFELRKNLEFISPALKNLTIGANFSYIYSQTNIDEQELQAMRANHPAAKSTREMYGQAPYSINTMLSYSNEKLGIQTNLVFNVTGPRIAFITVGGTPNTYVKPRPTLNFNINKKIVKGLNVSLAVNNILMSPYQEAITFKGRDYNVYSYDTGMVISLGLKYKFNKA